MDYLSRYRRVDDTLIMKRMGWVIVHSSLCVRALPSYESLVLRKMVRWKMDNALIMKRRGWVILHSSLWVRSGPPVICELGFSREEDIRWTTFLDIGRWMIH